MRSHAAASRLLGRVVGGRYRLIQRLGGGGTADVYLAEASLPGASAAPTRVAVKILRGDDRDLRDAAGRLEREAYVASHVKHANVLRVLDGPFESEGARCIVLELLLGVDLADTLAYASPLRPSRAVRIAAGAADGLGAAHAAGILHRDVKPENLFLVQAPDGTETVKLLDFGNAWTSSDATGAVARAVARVGTPGYMAPEQARGDTPRPAGDVYALGVVLFEMLGGRVPAKGAIRREGLGQVSVELHSILDGTLAQDPSIRTSSMTALAETLRASPEYRGL